jgi:hypothetical protein
MSRATSLKTYANLHYRRFSELPATPVGVRPMDFLKFFRRKSIIRHPFTPDPATMQSMYQRDHVRPQYNVPESYAELMVLHRQIGQICANPTSATEEILSRYNSLVVLERQTLALYERGEIAQPVFKRIGENIGRWRKSLQPESQLSRIIMSSRKFLRSFGA